MVECEYCGRETDDPQACAECGGVYCHDHEKPLMHECASIEGAVGDDVFDPSVQEDDLFADAGGTLVWAGVVLGTVVLLVGLGVATGIINPWAIFDFGGADPGDGGDAPGTGVTTADFDEAQFREEVLEQMNDWRAERDLDRLSTDDGRRTVIDGIAKEMADVEYFNSPELQDNTRFAPKQRLAENGFDCPESKNVRYFTAYDRPIETDDGETKLTNSSQAAAWVSEQLREELGRHMWDPDASVHSLGVHVTDDNLVYVVYVTC